MANDDFLETLKNLFSEKSPSKEQVLGLMDETMQFFNEIKKQMSSENPDDQKDALEKAMAMKSLLESKMKELKEKTGLEFSDLAALAEKQNSMTPAEKNTYEAARARLQQLKEEPAIPRNKHLKTQKI